MKRQTFKIIGEPVASPRLTYREWRLLKIPRHRVRPEYLRKWDTAKNYLDWKNSIILQVRMQKPEFYPGAVSLSCYFFLSRPASAKRAHHTVKPDRSNLLKTIEDALTGVCYKDDCQVVSGFASKEYTSNEPQVIVTLNSLD